MSNACCSPEELTTCCAPSEKAECCGTPAAETVAVTAPSSCGCS